MLEISNEMCFAEVMVHRNAVLHFNFLRRKEFSFVKSEDTQLATIRLKIFFKIRLKIFVTFSSLSLINI